MLEYLTGQVAWHAATARHLLRATPPWVVLVPVAGALVIYLLNLSPAVAPYLDKPTIEIVSPIVLVVPVVLAGWLAATRGHAYDKWQALFALALFARELHFQGAGTGFYIALVLLLWWLSHARERLEPFFSDRRVVTVLMATIWTYAITKALDRGYLDFLLPAGTTRDLFEENLELFGHLLFTVLVVVSFSVLRSAASARTPAAARALERPET